MIKKIDVEMKNNEVEIAKSVEDVSEKKDVVLLDGQNGDDLLVVSNAKRKPELEEGTYAAQVIDVLAEKKFDSKYDKTWIKITLKFAIKSPLTGNQAEVNFFASKSLDKKSRLYPIVKGIIEAEPSENFDLRLLKGKIANVSIQHYTDKDGNVWENIISTSK